MLVMPATLSIQSFTARSLALLCVVMLAFAASADERGAPNLRKAETMAPETKFSLTSLLSTKPNPNDYRDRKQCISKNAIRNHEVLSKRHIVFTMRGKAREKYLVQFGRHCFGLHKKALLNVESRGSSRLCVGDSVRTEVVEFGRRGWGPRCTIPRFESITDYQVELLKDALRSGRVE